MPHAKFDMLADTSKTVAANARDTFARLERLQRKFIVATLPVEDRALTVAAFEPAVDGHSFDLGPELAFRQAALQVFADYAAVLRTLATEGADEDIDTAAQKLGASLKQLSARAPRAAPELPRSAGILATVLDALGRDLVRKKRLEGLKSVMDGAQPDLEKLGGLLAKSNEKIERVVSLMLDRIVARAARRRPPEGPAREGFDTAVADSVDEARQIKAALAAISDAAIAYPKAHAELRAMLDHPPTTYEALQTLVEQAEELGEFYQSLGDSNHGT